MDKPVLFGSQPARIKASDVLKPAPTPMPVPPEQAKPVIMMYVRRGEYTTDLRARTRTISLHPIPEKVSMDEWLDYGFGFDGDTVSIGINAKTSASLRRKGGQLPAEKGEHDVWPSIKEDQGYGWTLADALNSVQRTLVMWLRSLDYEVKIG